MEKIKIIDLLNKIANGEEVPKTIRFGERIYEYKEDEMGFITYYTGNYTLSLFRDYTLDDVNLNSVVEILEEDKKIKKIEYQIGFGGTEQEVISEYVDDVVTKVNEIIDYINKENK